MQQQVKRGGKDKKAQVFVQKISLATIFAQQRYITHLKITRYGNELRSIPL